MKPIPTIEIDLLIAELNRLAGFSACPDPSPAVTRIVFSDADRDARAYLRQLYEEAGLVVRVDAIGNTFARWVGRDAALPAVGTGSHTDAIPFSGMYDGTVGVLGALEAIRALQRSGFEPSRSIELVMFTSEEPTRFGIGCAGSRLMSGSLDAQALATLKDDVGDSFDTVRQRAGFDGQLESVLVGSDYYHAFVELHIEQGPLLERSNVPIGVVTAIAAPATLTFSFVGEGGHAGAVLMADRRDALIGAAELVTTMERLVQENGSPDLVATVGKLEVHPGAVNSIPSNVQLTLDIRDIDGENRDDVINRIVARADSIAHSRMLKVEHAVVNADPPAVCDEKIVNAVQSSAARLELSSQLMVSRAYHDSLFMARLTPTGMIFIPCKGGVSHRPDEFASADDIASGVATLALTLAELAD